jgi:hypothetical protein
MSTSLLNCFIAACKEIGDYWSSTTTGAGSATTMVDASLMAKANDWITDYSHVFLTEEPASAAAIYDERKVSSLDNSSGTLTNLTFAAAPGTGIDYMMTRLFSPSDYRLALIHAAKDVHPHLFNDVWDETLVNGNWAIDGSLEIWTTSTDPTYWTDTTLTATQTSSATLTRHGDYSCRLSTLAGTLSQSVSNFSDLQFLRGQTVKFTLQAYCDTTSSLRISINDGITQTYSSYHAGDSAWTEDNPQNDGMYVEQNIDANATQVTFTIHYENAAATCYVDDARIFGPTRSRLYIGHLGLEQNRPITVEIDCLQHRSQYEPLITVRGWDVDPAGFLYIPSEYPINYGLRIRGRGYLGFTTSGITSTAWTATIPIDEPQLQILTAQTILYLCQQMIMPNFTSGDTQLWQANYAFWKQELATRKARYGMNKPNIKVVWTT